MNYMYIMLQRLRSAVKCVRLDEIEIQRTGRRMDYIASIFSAAWLGVIVEFSSTSEPRSKHENATLA